MRPAIVKRPLISLSQTDKGDLVSIYRQMWRLRHMLPLRFPERIQTRFRKHPSGANGPLLKEETKRRAYNTLVFLYNSTVLGLQELDIVHTICDVEYNWPKELDHRPPSDHVDETGFRQYKATIEGLNETMGLLL